MTNTCSLMRQARFELGLKMMLTLEKDLFSVDVIIEDQTPCVHDYVPLKTHHTSEPRSRYHDKKHVMWCQDGMYVGDD